MEQPERGGGRVRGVLSVVGSVLLLLVLAGCQSMPPLGEQERLVESKQLTIQQISPKAFVNVWGKPIYHHSEFTQFFVMPDKSMIPRSRVPIGEAPEGWEASFESGEGVFLGYPEQGWLLVFVDDRLVYREELKADKVHALGKTWQFEDRFKTSLEGVPLR
ncbi:conserved hypothetical protein [Nitrospira lenta]|uniref:Lipoprotein n=1 Tax=Nitrospira lenta TaxID=1436998 RepID=A0A330L6K9_9BACT|nr:conserved hypothetical protein [Nitrospira lenta]